LLLFGTAGIPRSTARRSSVAGIARTHALGLQAMELEFVQRVTMGQQTAQRVGEAAEEHGVRLSVHAPYYINFNSREPEKVRASRERLLSAARVAGWCGARNVVFHASYYHDDPPALVFGRVKAELASLVAQLRDEGVDVCLRPETMGKRSQFGDLREVLQLAAEIDGVGPCIDVGHLHARAAGGVNRYDEFVHILEEVKRQLGESGLQDMHLHVQGMAYTEAGERKHLNLLESDLRYRELVQALADCNVSGTAICESPNLEKDALLLQQAYLRAREAKPTLNRDYRLSHLYLNRTEGE
jgi:deoxyribonuclease-4